jgi:lipoprotein NlpD
MSIEMKSIIVMKSSKALKLSIMASGCICLFACATRVTPAPIVNITAMPSYLQTNNLTNVTNSSTNNSQVATSTPVNNPPAKLASLNSDDSVSEAAPPINLVSVTPANKPVTTAKETANSNATWLMPTTGNIVQKFTPGSKGIDISGSIDQAIVAINSGKVVYSGNGLKGYGNLVIVKHDNGYLSAYAHNKSNLVQEGALVKRGQKIALMGTGDNGTPLLHLELRKNGKPIDPLSMIGN